MVKQVESIVKQALDLNEADRAIIIRRLIESLDAAPARSDDSEGNRIDGFFQDPEVKQAWDEEIRLRIERMDRGETTFVPGHEVVARIREQLRRSRDVQS